MFSKLKKMIMSKATKVTLLLLMAFVLLMAFRVFVTLPTRIQADSSKMAEWYCKNNAAKIVYSPDIWEVIEVLDGYALQIKNEKRIANFGISVTFSPLEQNVYIANIKDLIKQQYSYVRFEENTLNNFPVLSYSVQNYTFATLIVKDGFWYYEVTFSCVQGLYPRYKDEVFKVMQNFQITQPLKDRILNNPIFSDPDRAETVKSFDESVGYNDEAVVKNLSVSGSELIGVWHDRESPEFTVTYYANGTYKEKKSADGASYIAGSWKYDPAKRVVFRLISQRFYEGEDISNDIDVRTSSFAIRNFDKKMMYGITLEEMWPCVYIKE